MTAPVPAWAGGLPEAVDDYVEALLPEDDILRAAQAAADAAGLPPIQVSPLQGRLLQLLALTAGARRALEIGTLAGVSAIWIARGLSTPGARLVTIEADPDHAAVAAANLRLAGLDDVVDLRVGRGVDVLAELADEGVEPFDLVFIDADKPSNVTYLEGALRLGRPGTVVVVDNVVRGGAVADAGSADDRVRGARAVIEAAAQDLGLDVTVVQTVGRKGYDGFLVARLR